MLTLTDREDREYLLNFDTPGKILLVRNGRSLRVFAVSIEHWTDQRFIYSRINVGRYAQLEHDLQSVIHRILLVECDRQNIPGEIRIFFDPADNVNIFGYIHIRSMHFFF